MKGDYTLIYSVHPSVNTIAFLFASRLTNLFTVWNYDLGLHFL